VQLAGAGFGLYKCTSHIAICTSAFHKPGNVQVYLESWGFPGVPCIPSFPKFTSQMWNIQVYLTIRDCTGVPHELGGDEERHVRHGVPNHGDRGRGCGTLQLCRGSLRVPGLAVRGGADRHHQPAPHGCWSASPSFPASSNMCQGGLCRMNTQGHISERLQHVSGEIVSSARRGDTSNGPPACVRWDCVICNTSDFVRGPPACVTRDCTERTQADVSGGLWHESRGLVAGGKTASGVQQGSVPVGASRGAEGALPRTALGIAHHIVRTEGIRGLYRGIGISMATFVPGSGIWWGAYGTYQKLLWEQVRCPGL
jgi:Mitochondrial carrier protein